MVKLCYVQLGKSVGALKYPAGFTTGASVFLVLDACTAEQETLQNRYVS